jgi:hypothetical protein
VRGSMAVRWVEVPLSLGLGDSYPNSGVTPRGPGKPAGQGVHREVESEGLQEKYQAVIDGGCLSDEPVGQRRGKVEPALWRRRRSNPPVVPRCVRAAWYGRQSGDPWRPCIVLT